MARISQIGVVKFNGGNDFPPGATGTLSAKVVILTDFAPSETVTVELTAGSQVIDRQTFNVPDPGDGYTMSGRFTIPNSDTPLCADIV